MTPAQVIDRFRDLVKADPEMPSAIQLIFAQRAMIGSDVHIVQGLDRLFALYVEAKGEK